MELIFATENKVYRSQIKMSDTDIFNGVVYTFQGQTDWWNKQNNNSTDSNRIKFNQMFGNNDDSTRIMKIKLMKLIQEKNKGISSEQMIISTLENVTYRTVSGDRTCNDPIVFYERYAAEQKDNIIMMLLLHKTLKEMRNNSNHMLGKILYQAEAIRRCIEFYLDLIDELTIS